MQVFELYLRRLLKRKVLVMSMIILPLVVTYAIVQIVQPSTTQQFAHMMNSIIGLLLIITLINPMQFYGDKKNATDRRILLSTHSVIRFYSQIIAVFLMISSIQLITVVFFVRTLTEVYFPLTVLEHGIILLAYTLLSSSVIGLGLIIICYSQSRQSSWIKLIVFGLVFVGLGGLLLPNEQLPSIVREVAIILPTNWLTKVVSFMLDGSTKHMSSLATYLIGLLLCAVFIMMGLTRTKSERI